MRRGVEEAVEAGNPCAVVWTVPPEERGPGGDRAQGSPAPARSEGDQVGERRPDEEQVRPA